MTMVQIYPVGDSDGDAGYHAVAGDKRARGHTAGEAFDRLAAQLPVEASGTLVIVQSFRPDSFFDVGQQRRLEELMARWRTARDSGEQLSAAEQAELDALIDEEVCASARRMEALLRELRR